MNFVTSKLTQLLMTCDIVMEVFNEIQIFDSNLFHFVSKKKIVSQKSKIKHMNRLNETI